MKKAAAFDIGGTVVQYPLYWRSLYRTALEKSSGLRHCFNRGDDYQCQHILAEYNTVAIFREYEVSSDVIFTEIL